MKVSVLILTKNEEQDLPGCLESVAWSDDIHVYDSFSTDGTVRIAQQFGAVVTQRAFDNWASHQNWGLANIPFKHSWVLYIDADERVDPTLVNAARDKVLNAGSIVAFEIERRDYFQGTWLRQSQSTKYYLRLFKPQCMRYERLVNPVSIPNGPTGRISGHLDHYPFSKGVAHWLNRHNSYSGLEAAQILNNRENGGPFSIKKAFFAESYQERRYHQKELFYRVPGRPFVKFLLLYLIKRGFLDGKAGLNYCLLQSFYELMIVLKTAEISLYKVPERPEGR